MASADDEKTRTRLLEAAGLVFAQRGFEKATIRDICAAANVNVSSVNYYFGDKSTLYVQTILYAHEVVFDQVPLPDWDEETSAPQKLTDFIEVMLQRMLFAQQMPWQAQLLMREFVSPTDACRELAEKYIRPHHQLLLGILDEMLPSQTPNHQRHLIAFSIVGQCLFYKMNRGVITALIDEQELANHFSPIQLAHHISSFSLAALGQTVPEPSPDVPPTVSKIGK